MKRRDIFKVILITFLLVLALGLLTWGVFYVSETQYKVSIFAIVAIIFTTITSVYTVTINNRKVKEREYELHTLKERQKVFEHFYTAYFEMLDNIRKKKKGVTNNVIKEMMEFKKGLMNWGSERIIKKYLEFDTKLIDSEGNQDKFNMFNDGDDFIKELRKELNLTTPQNLNVMSIILSAEARKELTENGIIK